MNLYEAAARVITEQRTAEACSRADRAAPLIRLDGRALHEQNLRRARSQVTSARAYARARGAYDAAFYPEGRPS